MINLTTKQELLSKPFWSYRDIMQYLNVSKTTAISIKKRAIKEKSGGVEYGDNFVKADSVLKLYGTSRSEEIEAVKKLIINETEGENNA